ncbi:unnamed protein product, partial [Amoebophrya sp. A25]|eukprot:GSA25T00006290001.1
MVLPVSSLYCIALKFEIVLYCIASETTWRIFLEANHRDPVRSSR